MYRTAPKASELARVNIDAVHSRSAGTFALVFGAFFVAYLFVRELVPQPPPEIADRVALALPIVLAAPLAFWSFLAARVTFPPKRLEHTHTSPSSLGALLVFFSVGVLLFVLLLWVIAPRTWSDAWTCHSNGRGKTSCSFASDVSGWATAIFAVGIIPAFGAAMAGLVVLVDVVRAFRRALGGLQLQIDSDIVAPEAGLPVTIDLVIGGNARVDQVEVRLERTASFRKGKSVDTRVQGAVVLFRGTGVATTTTAPAVLRGQGIAPPCPNAADIGAESVAQRFVVEYVMGGSTSTETFGLGEPG